MLLTMRLPPIYYTRNYLEAFHEPDAPLNPITKYIGESATFNVFLQVENLPVNVDDWDIDAIIKPSVYSGTISWRGELGVNIIPQRPIGYYDIVLSAEDTRDLKLQGTYFLDIQVKEKIGRFQHSKDSTLILASIPIGFKFSNFTSLTPTPIQEGERTEPNIVDIKRI